MDRELKDAIINKQGELLYSTFSEECAEVVQALSKIQRKKYYDDDFTIEIDHLLEEMNDVLINIELMKEQLCREYPMKSNGISVKDIENRMEQWNEEKMGRLRKIFL